MGSELNVSAVRCRRSRNEAESCRARCARREFRPRCARESLPKGRAKPAPRGEPLMTASGRNFVRGEVNRKGASSMGSERPENCPVDSFQWRTGGSPARELRPLRLRKERPLRMRDETKSAGRSIY